MASADGECKRVCIVDHHNRDALIWVETAALLRVPFYASAHDSCSADEACVLSVCMYCGDDADFC